MTTRREPLCRVKGCPHPSDPDWHRCFVCGKPEGDHQHFPKKSLAGKGAKIVAFLCRKHHELLTLNRWREGVYTHPDGSVRYYIQNEKGENQCERIIEAAPENKDTDTSQEVYEDVTADDGTILTCPAPRLPAVKERAKKPAIQYEAVGLRLPENLTREQWEEVAGTIQQMVISVPWWVGDVLVYGQRFGEEMWQAIKDRGGADYERLRKYMWVAENVPIGTRVPMLKWSHHREVADLEPDKQRAWLQRAQDDNLSANALRKAISGEEPEPPCPESATGRHHYICEFCQKEK